MLRLFISRVECISKRENTQNVKSWAVGEQWKKGRTGIPPLRIWCKLKWYLYNRHVKWLERKGDQFWCESGLTCLKLRSSGMRSKQNFIFSSLLFFRFNKGKFKCHSRPFPFQNFKYGHKWVSHRSPCLFNSAYAKPNDRRKLSKLTNHRVYKQLVYQKEAL